MIKYEQMHGLPCRATPSPYVSWSTEAAQVSFTPSRLPLNARVCKEIKLIVSLHIYIHTHTPSDSYALFLIWDKTAAERYEIIHVFKLAVGGWLTETRGLQGFLICICCVSLEHNSLIFKTIAGIYVM